MQQLWGPRRQINVGLGKSQQQTRPSTHTTSGPATNEGDGRLGGHGGQKPPGLTGGSASTVLS